MIATTTGKISHKFRKVLKSWRKKLTKIKKISNFEFWNEDQCVLTDTTITKVWFPPQLAPPKLKPQAASKCDLQYLLKMWPKIFVEDVTWNIFWRCDLKYLLQMWPEIFVADVTWNIFWRCDLKYLLQMWPEIFVEDVTWNIC